MCTIVSVSSISILCGNLLSDAMIHKRPIVDPSGWLFFRSPWGYRRIQPMAERKDINATRTWRQKLAYLACWLGEHVMDHTTIFEVQYVEKERQIVYCAICPRCGLPARFWREGE